MLSPHLPGFKAVSCCFFLFFSFYQASAVSSSGDTIVSSPAVSLPDKEFEIYLKDILLRTGVLNQARQFLGTRYRYGGQNPDTGFDCSGFTSYILNLFQVNVPHSSRGQAMEGRDVPLEAARPGDLILFRRSRTHAASHVAFVYENGDNGLWIIHSTSRGVVIDNLNESQYWKPKVFAVRDIISDALEDAVLPPESPGGENAPVSFASSFSLDLIARLMEDVHLLWW